MRRYARRRRRRKRGRIKRWGIVLMCCLLTTVCLLDHRLRPVMLSQATAHAKGIAIAALNRAVADTLDEMPLAYDSLIVVDYGTDGEIRSLQACAGAVNRVKAAVNTAIIEALSDSERQSFSVPLGTLSGIAFFSGRGPSVSCRATVLNTPLVTLESELKSAGINQTLHRLDLCVRVPLTVSLPMQTGTVTVETTFLLAQTVLVGDVPDSYTDVISEPQMVGDIFDYADLE